MLGRDAGGCLARTQGGCNGGALAPTEDKARRRLRPSRCVGTRRRDHYLKPDRGSLGEHVVQLVLDAKGEGRGTICGAAKIKPTPDGGVEMSEYAQTPVELKVKS